MTLVLSQARRQECDNGALFFQLLPNAQCSCVLWLTEVPWMLTLCIVLDSHCFHKCGKRQGLLVTDIGPKGDKSRRRGSYCPKQEPALFRLSQNNGHRMPHGPQVAPRE